MAAKSFLVIGGGLIGVASALRLQAAGLKTILIDPGDARRAASFGNAGHIAAEQVAPWASRQSLMEAPGRLFAFGGALDFRWRDAGLWWPWAMRVIAAAAPQNYARGEAALSTLLRDALPAWRRIADLAGAPEIVGRDGHAIVWMSPHKAEAGRAAWARAPLGATSFREMNAADLERYAPVLRTAPVAGIQFQGTAPVSEPQAAREAIVRAFLARGGECVVGTVMRLEAKKDQAVATLQTGETISADSVLIAAGAWSGALMRPFGIDPPLIGERGYSVQSPEHAWGDLPTTVFEEHSMVVARFTSGLRASSFLEMGSPDAPGDPRKWRMLQRHLRQLGIAFSDRADRWVGPRPTLPDYLPAIGRLESNPNVYYAFGHQHLGLTMSAITSEIIAALATDAPPPLELAPFRVERFA